MTVAAIAAHLLTFFSPEERSIPDSVTYPGRNAWVVKAINDALQQLFGKGGQWVKKDDRGAVLNAPTAVTISVTNGSTAGTVTGWASWMAGCTIVIDGADVDNQIRNASSTVKLRYPYSGTTGTKSALVYHDSIELGTDVLEVHEPVRLDRVPLLPMASPYEADPIRQREDFGFAPLDYATPRVSQTAGPPRNFLVETWSLDDVTAPKLRLRLAPAPAAVGFLDYNVLMAPPFITDAASTAALPIPFAFIQSIFLPIATKKLKASPFWRDTGNAQEINDGYLDALELLKSSNPNQTQVIRLGTQF